MRRPDGGQPVTASVYDPLDDEFARHWPRIAEFVMDSRWDDGKPRKPGTVMLVNDAGTCKAWVHDVDGRRAAWVSADSLWGLLGRVEDGLQNNSLEWRKDRSK